MLVKLAIYGWLIMVTIVIFMAVIHQYHQRFMAMCGSQYWLMVIYTGSIVLQTG